MRVPQQRNGHERRPRPTRGCSTSPPSTISARTRRSSMITPPMLQRAAGDHRAATTPVRRSTVTPGQDATRSVARSTTTSCSPTSRCRASTSICVTRMASWVLVDRGSGNGTIVNGNIEDQPFMLANGDVDRDRQHDVPLRAARTVAAARSRASARRLRSVRRRSSTRRSRRRSLASRSRDDARTSTDAAHRRCAAQPR